MAAFQGSRLEGVHCIVYQPIHQPSTQIRGDVYLVGSFSSFMEKETWCMHGAQERNMCMHGAQERNMCMHGAQERNMCMHGAQERNMCMHGAQERNMCMHGAQERNKKMCIMH